MHRCHMPTLRLMTRNFRFPMFPLLAKSPRDDDAALESLIQSGYKDLDAMSNRTLSL